MGTPWIFLISFTSLIYVHSALRSSNSRADGWHVFMRPVTFVTLTRDPRVTCDRVWLVWKTFYRQCKCGVSCAATTPSQKSILSEQEWSIGFNGKRKVDTGLQTDKACFWLCDFFFVYVFLHLQGVPKKTLLREGLKNNQKN